MSFNDDVRFACINWGIAFHIENPVKVEKCCVIEKWVSLCMSQAALEALVQEETKGIHVTFELMSKLSGGYTLGTSLKIEYPVAQASHEWKGLRVTSLFLQSE